MNILRELNQHAFRRFSPDAAVFVAVMAGLVVALIVAT